MYKRQAVDTPRRNRAGAEAVHTALDENVAVIEKAEVNFTPGFNVLDVYKRQG